MAFIYSKHALEQMELRQIPAQIVEVILAKPEQITREAGKTIYQSVVNFINEGSYLIRIFVNEAKEPNIIITVYRTSKISKYHETKI